MPFPSHSNYPMKIKELTEFSSADVDAILRRVPFYKELQLRDVAQRAELLRYSCVVELDPGETIMRRGERGSWLYFLIKGELLVHLDESAPERVLNTITPGELFGDLALLCDQQRKATVTAASGDRKVVLLATDFKPFGDLLNFNRVSLGTKLVIYRTIVHSIRWRLEVKRMESPQHPLAAELRKVPTFAGERETVAELQSLHDQAIFLASLLDRWNSSGDEPTDLVAGGQGAA